LQHRDSDSGNPSALALPPATRGITAVALLAGYADRHRADHHGPVTRALTAGPDRPRRPANRPART